MCILLDIFILLAEVGGMIGTPVIDIGLLRKQSPDEGTYNAYAQGKVELQKIIELSKL